MISIAEADLGSDIVAEFVLVYGFYGGRSADGHEDGGLNRAMVGLDLAGSGLGIWVGVEELEGQG